MTKGPESRDLEQFKYFRPSTIQSGPQPYVSSPLDRLREAVEFARRTELQNQRVQARGRELAHQVAQELELAAERVRSAEARAHAAEIRAAVAEARAAEIQRWLDSVHDLIIDEFPIQLTYEGEREFSAQGSSSGPELLEPKRAPDLAARNSEEGR